MVKKDTIKSRKINPRCLKLCEENRKSLRENLFLHHHWLAQPGSLDVDDRWLDKSIKAVLYNDYVCENILYMYNKGYRIISILNNLCLYFFVFVIEKER